MKYVPLLLAISCAGSKDKAGANNTTVVGDIDFSKLDDACPGEPRIEECAGVTPRLDFVVTDASGAPMANVLVGAYPEEPKRDATKFPAQDGLGRKKYYGTCTNAEGRASVCPFDAAKTTVQNVLALKSGYALAAPGVTMYGNEAKTISVTLTKDAAAIDSKVLILSCERGNLRDPLTFVREHMRYTVAPFGKAIDMLFRDESNPFEYFDTLYLGKSCASSEAWGELLVPAKNERLWKWVNAGGLLFLAQLEDSLWSKGVNGCVESCAGDVFPTELRFDLFPESPCNDVKSGTVLAATHPTMAGVDLTGWSHNSPSSPTKAETRVAYNLIKRDGLPSAWTALAVGPNAGVADECAGIAEGKGVIAAEATYGKGKVFVGNHAWETGSQGDISGGMPDPKGIVAKNNIFAYLKAHAL